MRPHTLVLAPLAGAVLLVGCGDITALDNYDEPSSTLTGQVVYQGAPVGVRNAGVELQIWQPGFELDLPIPVYIAQDGSFSAVLFDGSYEINLLAGGPWVDDDQRTPFDLNGSANLEIPVTPYYVIQNESIANNSDVIQATFSIGQVETSCSIQRVGLYVNTTAIVDRTHQVVRAEMDGSAIADPGAPIDLSVELPDDIRVTPSPEPRTSVSVRVGVQADCAGEMAYSQVQAIGL